ncbi:probable cyclin-dependent serine/threonine-protein kinase DDB_G0292550 [Toxorhynchites rutilus septentrionalis]|uniref:probable cyclin-dependent serine/threonine-protein kinase DDB_G0292550 n=1 Tax=Toxorhynchites rutilus septentrionalis TaxID=329112 RepID=UPI00247AAF94|nr:probable cyclin-dependent serine/threonine-protein kinase DDB_G0292550 [Toxorhynchites rutilus septentrionalis]
MAQALEIIKTIPILVPHYNGEGEKLNSTIAALNACKSLINNDNQAIAIQVILSRLEGKARSAVGDNPQNVDEIIEKLKNKCTVKVAPESVVAKLNAIKQNSEIGKFTDQIEKLTLQLERAYIDEDVPVGTASRMSTKAGIKRVESGVVRNPLCPIRFTKQDMATVTGIKALASGVRNHETKLILKAGQFSTLSAAIETINENEQPHNDNANIMHYRTQNSRNNPHQGNRPSYNNRNRNNSNHNNNNFRRNDRFQSRPFLTHRKTNNYNGYQRQQHNQNYNRHPQNRAPFNSTRNNGSRVFLAQSGNAFTPQQITVGGTGQVTGQGTGQDPRQSQGQYQNVIQEQQIRPQRQMQGQVMTYTRMN